MRRARSWCCTSRMSLRFHSPVHVPAPVTHTREFGRSSDAGEDAVDEHSGADAVCCGCE